LSSAGRKRSARRAELLERVFNFGRENSDATVFFHEKMATLVGLHGTDYKTLSVLDRLGPLSAGEIADHTGLATASVTNLIDRLESKGFVRRARDEKDRRRVLVEPVADWVAKNRPYFAPMMQSLARLLERYSDDELEVIADFLSRNAERLREDTKKLRQHEPAPPSGAPRRHRAPP
jgi:DNA-binding MarR family transcriptional regulator